MRKNIRSFIAIPLPHGVVSAAEKVQTIFKAAGIRLKWVRPENMHLTMKFLGDIEERKIPEVIEAIRSISAGVHPFSLITNNIGVFPNIKTPRVVWMGFGGEVDPLMNLFRALDNKLASLGFPTESRPFTGHLTLGRVADRIDFKQLQELISSIHLTDFEKFTVSQIDFIKSDLRPSGAVYTNLAEVSFSEQPEKSGH